MALFLTPFLAFKATGGLKIPSSFQDPHHIRVTHQQESPPGPGALVYFEKLTQHQLRALLAPVPPRGCLPGLLCADTDGGLPIVLGYRAAPPARGWPAPWATRSAFIIPDDKAYCPEEFKAPSNRLPQGQESCHCLFPRITSSPLALPAPPFLSLSPPHHPSSP